MRYIVEVAGNGSHRIVDTMTPGAEGRGDRVPYGSLSTYKTTDGRTLYGATDYFSGVLPTESVFEIVFPVEHNGCSPKEPAPNTR